MFSYCIWKQKPRHNIRMLISIYVYFAEHATSNVYTEAEPFDPCHMYERHSEIPRFGCHENLFNSNKSLTCERYVYDKSQMTETISTKLNLVCNEAFKRRLFNSALMLGQSLYIQIESFTLKHFINSPNSPHLHFKVTFKILI